MRSFFVQVLQIAAKDLRVEWRSREIVYTMTLFAALLVVVFAFAFGGEGHEREVAGGLLWVAIAFSGTLGLGRVFARERDNDTLSALLLSPASPAAIYAGKLLGTLAYMAATEVVIVPLLVVLFSLDVTAPGLFVALVVLGTVGFAAVGSLFAAALMRASGRDVLLGLLTYPLVTPVLAAGAKGTAALIVTPPEPVAALVWMQLLVAFDLLFVSLSLLAFGPLVSGE